MSIASEITSMGVNLQADYQGLVNIGGDITGINKNILNIRTILDTIYNDLPKVTGEGTEVTLTPTRKGRLAITPKGNSTQESTNGYQLFDSSQVENVSDYIVANGTGIKIIKTTNGRISPQYNISLEANTEYIISCNLTSTTTNPIMYCQWKANDSSILWAPNITNGSTTFTPSKDIVGVIFYLQNIDTDGTYVELKNLQIEKGSTAHTWEKYTGGIPSPNPSYPQPIKSVTR